MSISKIRIGNQISLQWTIKQGDTAYDLSAKTNKVYLVAPMARYEVTNFTLSGDNHNIINITWRGVDQRYCGEYHLLLVSVGSNGENMFSLDSMPCFILTPVTDQSAASTATTVQLTDNIMMPSSGESLYEMMVRNGLFDGTEAEFLQEYEDKLDACETATDAANDAATDADTAAGNATTAAATANSAATNANTKAALANTKAQLAAEKAALADTAASNADSKADAAHTAATEAAAAAELAETKAGLANTAAGNANSAASSATSAASAATSAAQSATSAASTANTKAQLAQDKADLANSAAESATSAASSANSAASSANTAATGAANVNATLSGNNLTITDRDGNSTTVNTKGAKGDPGDVSQEEFTALALQVSNEKGVQTTITGNGSTKDFTINHNLDSKYNNITIWEDSTSSVIMADVLAVDANNLQIKFAVAPYDGAEYVVTIYKCSKNVAWLKYRPSGAKCWFVGVEDGTYPYKWSDTHTDGYCYTASRNPNVGDYVYDEAEGGTVMDDINEVGY